MHVMFLSGSGELGGAERSLLDVAASLRLARPSWSMSLLAPAAGPLVDHAAMLGVQAGVVPFGAMLSRVGESNTGTVPGRARLAVRLGGAALPAVRYVGRLRSTIRELEPDIIHTHGIKVHMLGAWANPGSAAVVWHLHDYVGRRAATAPLLRRCLNRCRAIVANSRSVADDARAVLGPRVPVDTVLNAVDLDRYRPDGPRLDLDALAGLARPATPVLRIGLLATFSRWKGHLTFLEAFARLGHQSARAYVIGGPVYRTVDSQYGVAELRAHAVRLGIADRVGFTGFVADADAALRALDVVVHASTDPEPFGLIIAEAMACGRAIVVSDAGGAHELFTAGVDALAHAPGDVDGLATCLSELATRPALRARLAQAAADAARRRFDRTRLAGQLVPVYERALTRDPHA